MNLFKLIRSYLLVACVVLLPSCSSQRSALKEQKPTNCLDNDLGREIDHAPTTAQEQTAPWITVWVHGTHPSFNKLPGKRLRAFVQKHAHNYFYCKAGVHPISVQPETNRHVTFGKLLYQSDPVRFPLEHFYTFGWSGDLSFAERYESGKRLYLDLVVLVEEYTHKFGVEPKIRLITHSHGGNVALNLAQAQRAYQKNLAIDELVLLACPIQEKTACLVQNALFKKVYSLYSSLDVLQVVDPQGLYKSNKIKAPLFSKRRFPVCYAHVAQAKIRFDKRAILHIEFLSDRFVRALPSIIARLEAWQQENIHDDKIKQICIEKDTGRACDLRCSYAHRSSE